MSERRVYVVDDEDSIRRSLAFMLRTMGYPSQVFEHGAAFMEEAGHLAPGCALLDIRMPHVDGLEVQRRLNQQGLAHSVVVMSGHGDLSVAMPAMVNGAVAFLEKPFQRRSLEEALRIGFAKLFDPEVLARYRADAAAAVAALDATEQQVLKLIASGSSLENVAEELRLPPAQLDFKRTAIFAKLELQSLGEALQLAFAAGLVGPETRNLT